MQYKPPKADYYITEGKKVGRVLRCNKPFYRGDGVFCFSSDPHDWELVSGAPLSPAELQEYIEEYRQLRQTSLQETLQQFAHRGYVLVKHASGGVKVMQK